MEKKVKILITGGKGFIGKNLISALSVCDKWTVLAVDRAAKPELLEQYCGICDFVIHLAGVNRPERIEEFEEGNAGFTKKILDLLKQADNPCPVLYGSSVQTKEDNPYGRSKKHGEELIFQHAERMNGRALIYRFPNIFGKWSRPDYNSVVATFCWHVSRNQAITVNDPSAVMELAYIDDLVEEIICALEGREHRAGKYCVIPKTYSKTVGEIGACIKDFGTMNERREIPDLSDDFIRKLYSTYLSYLPKTEMKYDLTMNCDDRGSFTEMLRTQGSGQISINISRPHVVKGNHWHQTKHEKFLVVKGQGIIRLRKLGEEEIFQIPVSGERLEAVEIPPGYIHNIENTGEEEMITVMWASELYNPDCPDTFYQEV